MLFFPLIAVSVILAWDPNPEPDIALYRLYVGIQPITDATPPVSSFPITAPATQYQLNGLTYGTDYWFVVTAINLDGLESGYSNEVQFTPMPSPTPSPTPDPTPTPTPEPTPEPTPTPKQGWWKHGNP